MAERHLPTAILEFLVDRAGRWNFLEIGANVQWAWIDEVADEGQPQSEAAEFARRSAVALPELLEQVRKKGLRDADARIADGELDM